MEYFFTVVVIGTNTGGLKTVEAFKVIIVIISGHLL